MCTPTVVLVHGAFDDASSWWLVLKDLKQRNVPVLVRSIPLRGLSADADYLVSALAAVEGPVLLVGHNYGGAVISAAAAAAEHVVGLVYVAAWILEVGEAVDELLARCPVSQPLPGGHREARSMMLSQPCLTTDSPNRPTADRAVTQPVPASVFAEPAPASAWHGLPSWAIVASRDRAIPAALQRQMTTRAGAVTVEIEAAHAIAVSHPEAVSAVIVRAVRTIGTERPLRAAASAATS